MEFQDQIADLMIAVGNFCKEFIEAGFLDRVLLWVRDVLSWMFVG